MTADLYAAYERLKFSRPQPGVLRIALSSPLKLNVMDARLHAELASIWRLVDRDDAVRAVLLTAEGPAFSAGGDLKHQKAVLHDHALQLKLMRESREMVMGMIDCSKPVVSAVRGWAVGAGLACALLADISIVAKDARLADGHVAIGLAAGDHAAILWPLLCGMAKAKYHLLLGAPMDGAEAERMGMVSLAVDDAELDKIAEETAVRLAKGSRLAISWTKHVLNYWLRQATPTFETSLALEILGMGHADAREGVDAFLEKRAPRFAAPEPEEGSA